MGDEVILYSHYGAVEYETISAFSLLYDRVILPLADFASSTFPMAIELRNHCPGIKSIVEHSARLRRGSKPLCCALTETDTPIVQDNGRFSEDFRKYLGDRGVDWQALCQDGLLEIPFATIHAFITQSILKHRCDSKPEIVFYATKPPSRALYSKIAAVLEVELEHFVVPRPIVDLERLDEIRTLLARCETRSAFRSAMQSFAVDLANELSSVTSQKEKKQIIRGRLDKLKELYSQWIVKLRTLEKMRYLRIVHDGDNNLLFLPRDQIRPSAKATISAKPYVELHLEAERLDRVGSLVGNEELRHYVFDVTWQRHLFTFSSSVKDAFGLGTPEGSKLLDRFLRIFAPRRK